MTVLKRGVAHGNCRSTANTNHDRRRGARFRDRDARLVREHFERIDRLRRERAS